MKQEKRALSERQLESLVKARQALQLKHTCDRCGEYDSSHGLHRRSEARISTLMHDGVMHRTCRACRRYYGWLETRRSVEQELQMLFADRTPFFVLDTETNGTLESPDCQVVEIALIDLDGQLIYQTLCRLDGAMPHAASKIHGLTDAVLADAPVFSQVWPDLLEILAAGVPVYGWNVEFDRQAIQATAQRFGLAIPEIFHNQSRWCCAMQAHARWYGEWSSQRRVYRWQSLATACGQFEIPMARSHRALDDARHTLHVMQAIAEQAGKTSPPTQMPTFFDRYCDPS